MMHTSGPQNLLDMKQGLVLLGDFSKKELKRQLTQYTLIKHTHRHTYMTYTQRHYLVSM